MLTRLRVGAFDWALSSSSSNSGIPDAARVASGPGEIEASPFLYDSLEYLLRLPLHIHVKRHEDGGLQGLCERLDVLLGAIIEVGDRQIGPKRAERLGAAPGDGLIVGDARRSGPFYPSRRPWYPEKRE